VDFGSANPWEEATHCGITEFTGTGIQVIASGWILRDATPGFQAAVFNTITGVSITTIMGFVITTGDGVTEVIRTEFTVFAIQIGAGLTTIGGGTAFNAVTDIIVVTKLLLWCVHTTLVRVAGIGRAIKTVVTTVVIWRELAVENRIAGIAGTVESIVTKGVVGSEDTAAVYTLICSTDNTVIA